MEISRALELINLYLKNSMGRYNSRCLNEKWFIKNGLGELFEFILENTKEIPERTLGEKLWTLEHLPIPLCSCGNPVKKYDGKDKWSQYCSSECALKSPERAKKISESKLEMDHSISNQKRIDTMLKKYGVKYNTQRGDVKDIISSKASKRQLTPECSELLEDYDWMYKEYQENKRSASDIAMELGCDYSTVLQRIKKYDWKVRQIYNTSIPQMQLEAFINSLGFETSSPTNMLSGKQEIDIFIESVNIGVEIDGLRFHSYPTFETKEQKNKHKRKTIDAINNGITLIHFTDYQWIRQQEIVKSMVRSKLNCCHKIFARKCVIKSVSSGDAKLFFDNTHIQGHVNSKYQYGLYFEDQLVSCMSFGVPRYDKNFDWELLRFSSQLNSQVIGGFSRLFKHFQLNHLGSIITYADMMRSTGNVYLKNGFELIRETKLGYFWTDGTKILSRTKCFKGKLRGILDTFEDSKSEAENMFANGYRRFWDCGQLVFGKKQ